MRKHSYGFIVDPLDHFDAKRETTLFLMAEAQRRGHRIFAVTLPDLFATQLSIWGDAAEIRILGIGKKPFYKILQKNGWISSAWTSSFLGKILPPI
jgi:glutathione synthase/RimK-type ligase-like ATP-grasp enzyme